MNREEVFALARGQSCSLTEMKGIHCTDSWDLFAGEKMHNFRMFIRLETTYMDQSHIRIYYTRITKITQLLSTCIEQTSPFEAAFFVIWEDEIKHHGNHITFLALRGGPTAVVVVVI